MVIAGSLGSPNPMAQIRRGPLGASPPRETFAHGGHRLCAECHRALRAPKQVSRREMEPLLPINLAYPPSDSIDYKI
jgi:hypothetical protein